MCGFSLWARRCRKRANIGGAIRSNTVFIAKKVSQEELEINARQVYFCFNIDFFKKSYCFFSTFFLHSAEAAQTNFLKWLIKKNSIRRLDSLMMNLTVSAPSSYLTKNGLLQEFVFDFIDVLLIQCQLHLSRDTLKH